MDPDLDISSRVEQNTTYAIHTPSTFPRFSALPKEIRLAIWEFVLPPPRIIPIECAWLSIYYCTRIWSDKAVDTYFENGASTFFDCHRESLEDIYLEDSGIDYGPDDQCLGFRCRIPAPISLHVCLESYEVTIRRFRRSFGTRDSFPETWFDFEQDTLYLDANMGVDPQHFPSAEASKVQKLAIFAHSKITWDIIQDGFYRNFEEWICYVLRYFSNAKKLTIVIKELHSENEVSELVLTKPSSFDEGSSYVSWRQVERYRVELAKLGLRTWDVLPEIDHQVLTIPKQKREPNG